MYKFYLGAFGNRSYIRPQYEILEDGNYSKIEDDRWEVFPNGGTVSVQFQTDNDVNDIKNRLLKFKIDFNKDLHPSFNTYADNSNKYQISTKNIEDLDRDEIIEVIDIDFTISEFLNDKTKRTIRIKHKPNKLILLRYEQDCYGPFEFMISDVEDSAGDETIYTLKIIVNSGIIKKYKFNDLERIILDGQFSIRRNDRMKFIYKLEHLERISPAEEIDYYDNEELADFLKKLLERSDEIEDISGIREKFLRIVDTFSEGGKLSDQKIKRISELLQTAADLSDCKMRITEEYFKNNPQAAIDKEEYLRTHEELLRDIARADIQYDALKKKLIEELETLQVQNDELKGKIEAGEQEIQRQQTELGKLEEQAVDKKKQEIEEALASKKEELKKITEQIEAANVEYQDKVRERDNWKDYAKMAKAEYDQITKNIDSKIKEWAAHNRNTEVIKMLTSQLEVSDTEVVCQKPQIIGNLRREYSADQISEIICQKLAEAGRIISKDEAYNYLISISQNYITVFAGEPGTGKTSMCKLLAKALGIYDSRFAEILVERGWTSSKDLIGYYNPLTKEIEKTQPRFSECMQLLDAENKNNIVEAPYFVLLDEANLSPIEFYWSHFNYYSDDPSHQVVEYSNGEKYEFGAELKFLATINYDQTTADLSPRFLDRAWIISMGAASLDTIVSGMNDDGEVKNNEEIISLELLNSLFGWTAKDRKMNSVTKTRLDRIVDKMKEGGHSISARSILAISHYYMVAEEYMSSKENALDYAVSQKILPCLNGNGKKYGEFLNSLMNICKENQLNRSANIILKIIDKSEHEFYSFFGA